MSRGIRPTRGVWGARGASPGGLSTSRSWPSRRGRRGTPLSGPPGERSGHTLRWRARRSSRPLRTSAPGPRGPARSSTARAAPDGAAPDAPPRARPPATRRRQIRLTKPAPRRRRSPRPRRRPRRAHMRGCRWRDAGPPARAAAVVAWPWSSPEPAPIRGASAVTCDLRARARVPGRDARKRPSGCYFETKSSESWCSECCERIG